MRGKGQQVAIQSSGHLVAGQNRPVVHGREHIVRRALHNLREFQPQRVALGVYPQLVVPLERRTGQQLGLGTHSRIDELQRKRRLRVQEQLIEARTAHIGRLLQKVGLYVERKGVEYPGFSSGRPHLGPQVLGHWLVERDRNAMQGRRVFAAAFEARLDLHEAPQARRSSQVPRP